MRLWNRDALDGKGEEWLPGVPVLFLILFLFVSGTPFSDARRGSKPDHPPFSEENI